MGEGDDLPLLLKESREGDSGPAPPAVGLRRDLASLFILSLVRGSPPGFCRMRKKAAT